MTPAPGNNRKRPRLLSIAVALALLTIGGLGCGDSDSSVEPAAKPDREFGQGYDDGFRDGMDAWSDMHAGWTWLWTKPEAYQQEYHRGWSDGRNLRKMKDRQEDMER